MSAINTFIVHKEWLENIDKLPLEQQDKVIADFVRYGVGLEIAYGEDAVVASLVNMLKGRIDYSKDKYEQKVVSSARGGRPKKVDNEEVRKLALEGKTAADIAIILGCSKSAIDHCEGWRNRKNLQ